MKPRHEVLNAAAKLQLFNLENLADIVQAWADTDHRLTHALIYLYDDDETLIGEATLHGVIRTLAGVYTHCPVRCQDPGDDQGIWMDDNIARDHIAFMSWGP